MGAVRRATVARWLRARVHPLSGYRRMTAALTPTTPPGATPSPLLWTILADELDIAPSLYQKASDRHQSLGR